MFNKLFFILPLVFIFTGCASIANMAGYDTATLNKSAAKSYAQVVQTAQSHQVLDTSSATAQRIYIVFNRLKPYAEQANRTGEPFNWQMNVIRSNEMNAWAMPGGKMAVYTGMVERLNLTNDEIAAVIGHEMAHALLEHGKKALGGKVVAGWGSSALSRMINANIVTKLMGVGDDLAKMSMDVIATKPFSRHQEKEADAGGVRLMAQAGYNPQAALTVWEKMNKIQGRTSFSVLSTHPTNDTRIAAIRKLLPEVMPIYERNKR